MADDSTRGGGGEGSAGADQSAFADVLATTSGEAAASAPAAQPPFPLADDLGARNGTQAATSAAADQPPLAGDLGASKATDAGPTTPADQPASAGNLATTSAGEV